ncbi:MAG TPA: glycine--tRNA ligase, partial [Candidatus Thermoplasmatota archaeon]|nr:glycine--tRNA ligase [Candidatus Thermoplasmatota archaeon]
MPGAPAPNERKDVHEELMALAKRRGFVAPSYEIYGGVAGFYDYGPMGAAMKNNLQQLWRRFYVLREGMAEIECPTISPEQVFRASGHLEKFADTVVECPECGAGMRGDHLVRGELSRIGRAIEPILVKHKAGALVQAFGRALELQQLSADKDPSPQNIRELLAAGEFTAEEGGVQVAYRGALLTVSAQGKPVHKDAVRCVACGKELDVRRAKISSFNLMFKTQVGPGSARAGYLRPETAQGMFMDFPWLLQHFRQTLPFGAVQIGRAYRNEISPRQAMLRLREFSQMEAEVFFDPQDKAWPGYELLAGRDAGELLGAFAKKVFFTNSGTE